MAMFIQYIFRFHSNIDWQLLHDINFREYKLKSPLTYQYISESLDNRNLTSWIWQHFHKMRATQSLASKLARHFFDGENNELLFSANICIMNFLWKFILQEQELHDTWWHVDITQISFDIPRSVIWNKLTNNLKIHENLYNLSSYNVKIFLT